MGPRVLVLTDPWSRDMASHVVAGLQEARATTVMMGYDDADVAVHEAADLVVLGALAASCLTETGGALRSWLARNHASHPGQLAAAFDVRHGRGAGRRETSAVRALRTMSSHGFRLASLPTGFDVTAPAARQGRERDRAREWGRALGETARAAPRPGLLVLAGSGQRN